MTKIAFLSGRSRKGQGRVTPARLAFAAVVVPWRPAIANSAIAVRMARSRLSCALTLPMPSFSLPGLA
ncbi:hypothetical protein PV419_32220 [Streptomyces sp. ME19-01-6]|nr:hypothetical protein [Streptomyces sp. ME19-01-6]